MEPFVDMVDGGVTENKKEKEQNHSDAYKWPLPEKPTPFDQTKDDPSRCQDRKQNNAQRLYCTVVLRPALRLSGCASESDQQGLCIQPFVEAQNCEQSRQDPPSRSIMRVPAFVSSRHHGSLHAKDCPSQIDSCHDQPQATKLAIGQVLSKHDC